MLKKLLSKMLGKFCQEDEDDKETEETEETQAYVTVSVNKENDLLIEGDFREHSPEYMAKLIFILSSGALINHLLEIVKEKCGEDSDTSQVIMANVRDMFIKYQKSQEDDDDEEPVVDPCTVFNQKREEIEDEFD